MLVLRLFKCYDPTLLLYIARRFFYVQRYQNLCFQCSSLFAVLPGYFFGPAVGIAAGFAHGILQFFLGPYILTPVQVFLDYGLGFAAFGLSGFFSERKYALQKGYLAACVGRWFFTFLSGWIFFGEYAWEGWNAAAYSAVYNIIYIAGEAVIVLIFISIPVVSNALNRVKTMALQ